ADRCAAISDPEVQASPLGHDAVDDPINRVFLTSVDRDRKSPPAEVRDLLGDGLEVLELARAQGDVGAGACELDRDRFANSSAAAGDDGGLAFQRERRLCHGREQYSTSAAPSTDLVLARASPAQSWGATEQHAARRATTAGSGPVRLRDLRLALRNLAL